MGGSSLTLYQRLEIKLLFPIPLKLYRNKGQWEESAYWEIISAERVPWEVKIDERGGDQRVGTQWLGKAVHPCQKKGHSSASSTQSWPRACKRTISVNTDTHESLMTSCCHHCTAAEEQRSPGRYETFPWHSVPSSTWITLSQLPWCSVLYFPDPGCIQIHFQTDFKNTVYSIILTQCLPTNNNI